jgi:hypothetical protein
MILALIVIVLVGGPLGLIALCAALRSGQCARLLEESPAMTQSLQPQELRRAA